MKDFDSTFQGTTSQDTTPLNTTTTTTGSSVSDSASRRAFVASATSGAIVSALPVLNASASHPDRQPVPLWHREPLRDDRKIRIAQIGVGHAHATKLSVYRRSPDYEVVGIAEPSEDLRKSKQDQVAYRDLKWMSVDQLLEEKLDAVLIETEVGDLLKYAKMCVDAGLHIHLDKPAGESLEKFQAVLESAAKQSLMVQMGYMYRYNPAIRLLNDFLQKGWLGEVFEVHAVMSKTIGPAVRKELAQFEGGLMFELGCHLLDLVVGILGKPERVHSYSRHSSPIQDELQDNMLSVLEYSKATATVRTSGQEVDGFARRHLVVCGDRGTFHIQPLDNPSARVALSEPRDGYKKGYQDIKFPKYIRYVDDAQDMANVLRGKKAPDFSYQHDRDVQATVLKASGL